MPAIKAKIPSRSVSDTYVRNAALATQRSILENLQRTTRTWRRPVRFQLRVRTGGGFYRVGVFTDDPLWIEINNGTTSIYHVLSRNFIPKTRPRVLDSFPGRGGRVGISSTPRPGIIPRQWDEAAAQFEQQPMRDRLQAAINNFVRSFL